MNTIKNTIVKAVGIDLGSSTIKLSVLEGSRVTNTWIGIHHGNHLSCLIEGLETLNLSEPTAIAITGSNCSLLQQVVPELYKLDDIPAIIEGVKAIAPNAASIIEIGSQGSRFITDLKHNSPEFAVNEHCAGGTGSFFEDQMNRLGLRIEDYSNECRKASSIPRLSGRCAVFAKTDITHRQQEGISTPDILLGLCYAMVRNYKATIIRDLPIQRPVIFCGGVTQNMGVVQALHDILKLDDEDLVISEYASFAGAIGAATKATGSFLIHAIIDTLRHAKVIQRYDSLSPLSLPANLHLVDPAISEAIPESGVSLGIDIGSTSTNLVLTGKDGTLVDFWYLRTAGNSERAVRSGLQAIHEKYGELSFLSVGVTGSGRERIGKMLGADAIRDEITAQAKGASFWVPDCDTVFEIGGQDSKYISIKNGEVSDFLMNKICAAGTGSFIEEQAARMGIPISEFGQMAMEAYAPSYLGERCTVFIETAISSAAANGVSTPDIAAGLCHSIVRNYLNKVVGNKKVGEHIVLQGGVAYNPGIVAAFRQAYGSRITVNPCFSISGAFGVALLALESMKDTDSSHFRGFDFDSSVTTSIRRDPEVIRNIEFYKKAGELLLDGYDGTIDSSKKTVGVPYALMIHKFFPMANAFFSSLGYNVLLSKPTDEDTILLSQQLAQNETCYPVKLIYGHMQQLVDAGVDYIFLPTIHTMKHEKSKVAHNYGCVYMQTAASSVANALHIEEKGIELLSPIFDLDFGHQAMASSMIGLGKQLNKSVTACTKALLSGAAAVRKHTEAVEHLGKLVLNNIRPDDKVLVLITRNYGVSDPILNMGIPELLLERGYKVITLSHLPAHNLDLSSDYPNLYWPFGQHILSGAKIIAQHPNLYAVYLTNHGCGPDSMLSHLFRQEMDEKPYLQIEVDEHFSKVGVITRIEAFLNSLTHQKTVPVSAPFNPCAVKHNDGTIRLKPTANKSIAIPDFGRYTPFFSDYLCKTGYAATTLPPFNNKMLSLGRTDTNSKEYLPFPALLGQIMSDCETSVSAKQYLIPNTRGAEADGQYAQTIYSILSTTNNDVDIFAPIIESLPHEKNFDLLCRAIITGDLLYAAPFNMRNDLTPDHIMEYEELLSLATEIGRLPIAGRSLGIVGSPLLMTSLNDGVLETLESEGETLLYAPLIEYLCMLWLDQSDSRKWLKQLDTLQKYLLNIHNALGARSSFSSDLHHLITLADESLTNVDGGNGRYRFAKAIELGSRCQAVLHLSPRYENINMVLDMRHMNEMCPAPLFKMSLDGDWDESSWSRLRSFLYYC